MKKKVCICITVLCVIVLGYVYRTQNVANLQGITSETDLVEANIYKHSGHSDHKTWSLYLENKENVEKIKEAMLNTKCRYRCGYNMIEYSDQILYSLSFFDADMNPYCFSFVDDGRVYSDNGYYVLTSNYSDYSLTKVIEEIIKKHQDEVEER